MEVGEGAGRLTVPAAPGLGCPSCKPQTASEQGPAASRGTPAGGQQKAATPGLPRRSPIEILNRPDPA